MAAWHHAKTAILFVRPFQGDPDGHASPRLHFQIELILMHGLAARQWRFEVNHALDQVEFLSHEFCQILIEPGSGQLFQ